jgi:small-conductance mechanosensitive channel
MDDLKRYLGEDEKETASVYMDLIDLDGNGDISRNEFVVAVKQFYQERDYLECSMAGNVKIIDQLSAILNYATWTVTVLTMLILLDETISDTLKMVGGATLSLTFVFGGTAADAFRSLVFILYSHPFDVGDKVSIDGKSFKVVELGLWACSFLNGNGALVYVCNNEVRESKIANTRRSGRMSEAFKIKVSSATSDQQLEALELELKEWCRENERDFDPDSLLITNVICMDRDRLELELEVSHKSNFQDGAVKLRRHRAFFFKLRDTLAKLDITLARC